MVEQFFEKIPKSNAKKAYQRMISKICGVNDEDALYLTNEHVISGMQMNNVYLIKVKDDYGNIAFELFQINHNRVSGYKSLVKLKNNFYFWTDDDSTNGKKIFNKLMFKNKKLIYNL